MLIKLLKYDIKNEFRSLLPVYLLALGLPIVLRILNMLNEMWPILATFVGITTFVYVLVVVGIFAWTLIVSIKHFYTNVLKDEGYLTNTLPVTRNQIVLSKEITSALTIVVSTIIAIISLFIAFYYGDIKEFLSSITVTFEIQGVSVTHLVYLFIILMLLSYISQMQIFFLSMMLGQTRNTNKVMFSIVFAILIYTVLQIASLVVLGLDYLIAPDIMDTMMNSIAPTLKEINDFVLLVFGTTTIFTIILMIGIHMLTVWLTNRKLNLE